MEGCEEYLSPFLGADVVVEIGNDQLHRVRRGQRPIGTAAFVRIGGRWGHALRYGLKRGVQQVAGRVAHRVARGVARRGVNVLETAVVGRAPQIRVRPVVAVVVERARAVIVVGAGLVLFAVLIQVSVVVVVVVAVVEVAQLRDGAVGGAPVGHNVSPPSPAVQQVGGRGAGPVSKRLAVGPGARTRRRRPTVQPLSDIVRIVRDARADGSASSGTGRVIVVRLEPPLLIQLLLQHQHFSALLLFPRRHGFRTNLVLSRGIRRNHVIGEIVKRPVFVNAVLTVHEHQFPSFVGLKRLVAVPWGAVPRRTGLRLTPGCRVCELRGRVVAGGGHSRGGGGRGAADNPLAGGGGLLEHPLRVRRRVALEHGCTRTATVRVAAHTAAVTRLLRRTGWNFYFWFLQAVGFG